MKNASFVLAFLLLVSFAGVAAAEPVADLPAVENSAPAAEAGANSSPDCKATAAAPLYNDVVRQVQTGPLGKCGPCSSAECVGMDRGAVCVVAGMPGFIGTCNLYTGGGRCPEGGGLECVCGNGPLP
jgi:hypothetical protein